MPNLLSLLLREPWAILPEVAQGVRPTIKALFAGENFDFSNVVKEKTRVLAYNVDSGFEEVESTSEIEQEDTVAIIEVAGVMLKHGDICTYGMDEIAELVQVAYNNDNINAIILLFDTPGGSTSSVIPLKEVLQNKPKPVIALVDNMACSAGIYNAVMCDKIIAIDPMAQVGSIGVMTVLINDEKYMEMNGFKEIVIYPPESSDKNKEMEEALKGKTDLYKKNILSPFAMHFQEHVKSHRPSLNIETDGVLSGRVYYAQDAVEFGLIDKILSMDDTISMAMDMANIKKVKSLINN